MIPKEQAIEYIKESIRKGWPQLVRSQPSFGWSDNGGGMQVHLSGPSTEMLTKLAADIVPVISQIKGLEDVRSEISDGQFEMQIQLNNEELQRQGLDASEVAQAVTLALRGTNLRTFRSDEQGEVQLRVLYDETVSLSQQALAAIPVKLQDNQVNPMMF